MKLSPAQIKALEFLEGQQRGWCLTRDWLKTVRYTTYNSLQSRGLIKTMMFIVENEKRWSTDYENGIHVPLCLSIVTITPAGRDFLNWLAKRTPNWNAEVGKEGT